MKKYILFGLSLVTLLNGCMVGPDYRSPIVKAPAYYKEAPEGWKYASPCDEAPKGPWWEVFNDPLLNELEERLNVSNQNIMAAYAQYMQARALVDQARAAYFPVVGANATVTPERSAISSTESSTTVSGLGTGIQTAPSSKPFINYNVQLDATWAPDIWGSVGRMVEANIAGAKASEAQVAATRLLAQASLALYYFELRGLDNDQKILDDTVKNYQKLLDITINQYNAGTVSRGNVLQAKSQLELAQVQAIDNGILRAQYEHAIAMLVGTVPADLSIEPCDYQISSLTIPSQIPSELLERRPDIAQAERLVAQANAQIGVAYAAYFPVLSLTDTFGYNAINFAKLFSYPSQFWSLATELAETLIDGGLRNAQVNAACATLHQMVAQYRQTVLAAFQNVEDNLVAIRILNTELAMQEEAVKTSEEALSVVLNEYKAGTVAMADILNAELTLYIAKKAANDIAYRRLSAAVNLIQALGGGWNVSLLMIDD